MRGSHPPGSVPPPYSHYPARLLMPDLATPPGPGPLSSPPPGPVATNTSPAALDSRRREFFTLLLTYSAAICFEK